MIHVHCVYVRIEGEFSIIFVNVCGRGDLMWPCFYFFIVNHLFCLVFNLCVRKAFVISIRHKGLAIRARRRPHNLFAL